MSGPYCETCRHFYRPALTPPEQGECRDPSKIIYSQAGNPVNSAPETWARFTCDNHESREGRND